MSAELRAEVKEHLGSPTLFVNGEPRVPMVFYGWAGSQGPKPVAIGPQWKQFSVTFVAPEDNEGSAGVQFRVGGGPPGTVWVDDVRLYPGPKQEHPTENMLRFGDWESTKAEMEKTWVLFQRADEGADVEWDVDTQEKVSGKQSCRVTIRGGGKSLMHAHFYQTGMSVKKGQEYTYSLWLKSSEERTVDFFALHQGEPWTIYTAQGNPDYESQVKLAAAAGVHIFSFGIALPWPKPGEEPNWAGVDQPIEFTLRNDPEALVMPRFGCNPPQWWLDEHPDEAMLFSDGKTNAMSMASELWLEECVKNVRALVRHCEAEYGDRFIGYHPCGQHTGEWFYERSWEPVLSDFSPAMNAGFRKWVRARYADEEALRRAWNEPEATFDGVAVPSAEEQLSTKLGLFRDPQAERKLIDYFEYKQLAMEQPLEAIARTIKEETGGRKLVTFFYGYLFDMHGIPMGPQTSGHLAMARMIRCPDVDILTSPISYNDRQLGGAGMFMSAVDSVRGGGKLWLNEDDTRTYLTPPDAGYGRVDTPQGSMWVHQRNFAQLLPRRLACWYMDLGGTGWVNGPDLWENIGRLRAIYEKELARPATFAAEVAVIVSETSPFYTKCTSALHSPIVYQMRSQCFRLGAPIRIHLLSDLTAGRVPKAKAYLFLNAFHLTDANREAIKRECRDATTVWLYGAGFLNEDASERDMADVTGLPLARGTPQPGRVTPEPGAGVEEAFGTDTVLDPLWTVQEGPGVQVLGRYADGSVAAAYSAEARSAYLGALHVPAKLLRNLLKQAGVHLYSDSDDVILADREFLGVVATSAGTKTISLPEARTVVDALTSEQLASDAEGFELEMQLGETRLLLLK
jgi:beta-galactosidase